MSAQGPISLILPLHIAAGVLALVFGYPALLAAKGGTLHRRSGLLFVLAMLTMSLTGASIAFLNGNSISLVAGLLTFYFVATALATVRPRHPETDGSMCPGCSSRSRLRFLDSAPVSEC